MTDYGGIDYGRGKSNVDTETGIRYGVISLNSLNPWIYEELENQYWRGCPECGTDFDDDCEDWNYCPYCGHDSRGEGWYGEEPIGWKIDDGELLATDCLDSDAMVIRSSYYTWAQYCSPCVPGAGNLDTPTDPGIGAKCYCLPADYFDSDVNPCPYPVYRVDSGECIYRPSEGN